MKTMTDNRTVCAACGATDTQLRRPTIPDPRRPDMRVCVEDKPCADRYSKRRAEQKARRH